MGTGSEGSSGSSTFPGGGSPRGGDDVGSPEGRTDGAPLPASAGVVAGPDSSPAGSSDGSVPPAGDVGASEDGVRAPPGCGSVGCCVMRSSGRNGESVPGRAPAAHEVAPTAIAPPSTIASRAPADRPGRAAGAVEFALNWASCASSTGSGSAGRTSARSVSIQSGRVMVSLSSWTTVNGPGHDGKEVPSCSTCHAVGCALHPRQILFGAHRNARPGRAAPPGRATRPAQSAVLTMKFAAWVT